MEEPVVLIVKAPNQQIDDQTIRCEVSWTVKKLKGHLSEVYPSKPRSEDQKLIYSGQLLTDNVTLKEVLRSTYEGQENHTLHLVCSPTRESLRASANVRKPKPAPTNAPQPSAPAPEGPRRRVGVAAAGTQSPAAPPPYAYPPHPSYATAQQMAWMQQAYAQYMAQYMQLMATGQMPMGMQMPMPPSPAGAGPAGPHPHPHPPAEGPPPADADAPQPEAEAGGDGEEGGAGAGGRDWLDWVYVLSRMMVLFSIVYFYSSPFRFFIVSTLGIIMYLYQMGFFRAVQRLDQAEEGGLAGPPPPAAADNNNAADAAPAPPAPPGPPSPLALTWAAFSSFFLSLIPEQPNVI